MPPGSLAESFVGTIAAGRYRVIQLLGSGGTGHVYLAEPMPSDRGLAPVGAPARVALKVLRVEHETNAALVARFEREAAAAARIRHPNVLEVNGIERTREGRRFFAMELLVGLDLADTLAFSRTLRPTRAVRIAAGVAEGLGAAHRAGVIHRDVKPENIFLVHAPDGRELVKLLDFGFASLQEPQESDSGPNSSRGDGAPNSYRVQAAEASSPPSGPRPPPSSRRSTVVGTPEYMAPEQAQGAAPHPSADVYSLGIALYEMLAGRVPFVGDSYPAIAYQHLGQQPSPMSRYNPALGISNDLEVVVARALAKSPEARFDSMEAVRRALLATPEAAGSGQ